MDLIEFLNEQQNKKNLDIETLERLVLCLNWLNNNLREKVHDYTNTYANLENYTKKLSSEIPEKNSELEKAQNYVKKILVDLSEKGDYNKSLEQKINELNQKLFQIQNTKKYYSSRL